MPLDPHVQRIVATLSMAPARDHGTADVQRHRGAFRGLMRLSETGSRVASIEEREVPGPAGPLAIRVYTPPDASRVPLPGLVYLHGGGFVCGDLDAYDALCRTLCEETGCRLIAVDYRLAPEHPFPAALQDALAATFWIVDHAKELDLDPKRIAIAGDSAGATLTAVICQTAAQSHPGALALQLLLCPILDWTAEAISRRHFGQGYLLDSGVIAWERQCYLSAWPNAEDPHVSPLRATDVCGQPPTYIHAAEFDPFRDDAKAYAERLQLAGVRVNHTCHRGMVHLFYGLGRVVPYARTAYKQIGWELRDCLRARAEKGGGCNENCAREA